MSLSTSVSSPQAIVASLEPLRRNFGRFMAQPAVRRSVPAVIVLAVLGVGLAGWLALQSPTLLPLYPGLAEAEKARVIEVLTGAGITANLQSQTGEIQVPQADYQRAKMVLAAQGLPESMPNSEEALGKLQLGSSRSVETMRLKQAQEAELGQTIAAIAGIASARVHLALPERTAFIRDMQPPTASVFVTLKSGTVLAAGQVEAIVNLVASSVPGLPREMVSVIDHRGDLLSENGEDAASRLTSRQMRERAQLERLYRSRIEALLMPLTGPENLSVEVTLDMDFTTSEVQSHSVIPDSATVTSEETQSTASTQPEARGIPGGVSNTPPNGAAVTTAGAAPAGASGSSAGPTNQSATNKRTYEVGHRIETTRPGGPVVLKISAAVLVGALPDGLDEATAAARLADMEKLVKGAIGFDEGRGDVVTVLAQPFVQAPDAPLLPAAREGAANALLYAGIGIGVLLIASGAGWMLLRRRSRQRAADAFVEMPAVAATATGALEPPLPQLDPAELELRQREERRLQLARAAMSSNSRDEKFAILRQLAEEEPARIAGVLRKMMKDEIDRVM